MKKISLILALCLTLAMLLTSCGDIIPEINLNHKFPAEETVGTEAGTENVGENNDNGTETGVIGPDTDNGEEPTTDVETVPNIPLDEVQKLALCATLTRLNQATHEGIVMEVITEDGSGALTATYTVGRTEVRYAVEKLNRFTVDNGVIIPPVSYKTLYEGTAIVENDRVISMEGDIVDLPEYNTLVGGFVFEASNFENVTQSENDVSFDVIDASAFWGSALDAEDMRVTVSFTPNRMVSLSASYTAGNTAVTVNYEFQ